MTRQVLIDVRDRFSNWRKRRTAREYLAVLFVDCRGRCPRCNQHMILSYENKTYENRATFNHKIPLAVTMDNAQVEDLEILCWKCNNTEGWKFSQKLTNSKQDTGV